MKILLIVNHPELKQQLLCDFAEAGHLVVGVGAASGINLLEEIARTAPHAVVLAVPILNEDESAILSFVQRQFMDLRVVHLTTTMWGDALAPGWEEPLHRELAREVPLFIAHDYARGQRLVFHDDAFSEFARREKLKQPRRDEHYQRILEEQRNRFHLLLEGGRQHHQDAIKYDEAARHCVAGLELEITYRAVHSSYKALIWSRDLVVGGLCAVLAHYVPGVELPYPPAPPELDRDVLPSTQSDGCPEGRPSAIVRINKKPQWLAHHRTMNILPSLQLNPSMYLGGPGEMPLAVGLVGSCRSKDVIATSRAISCLA